MSIRPTDKPWINGEFKRLIRKRNRLRKRFKRSNDPVHYQQYKKIRNAVVSLNRKNILAYHNSIEDQLINNSNPKLFWKSIKNIISHKSDFGIPPIKHDDNYITDDKENVNCLINTSLINVDLKTEYLINLCLIFMS